MSIRRWYNRRIFARDERTLGGSLARERQCPATVAIRRRLGRRNWQADEQPVLNWRRRCELRDAGSDVFRSVDACWWILPVYRVVQSRTNPSREGPRLSYRRPHSDHIKPLGRDGGASLVQIKHTISLTEKNETFAEVVKAAWIDFKTPICFDAITMR